MTWVRDSQAQRDQTEVLLRRPEAAKPWLEDRQDTNQQLQVSETNGSLGNMATEVSVIYVTAYYDI